MLLTCGVGTYAPLSLTCSRAFEGSNMPQTHGDVDWWGNKKPRAIQHIAFVRYKPSVNEFVARHGLFP